MLKEKLLILNICSFLSLCTICYGLSCKNEKNKPVDWYVLYKIPRISKESNTRIKTGDAYAYITSDDVEKGWTLSKISINNSKSIPGYTLKPLYNNQAAMYIAYNDEPPSDPTNDYLGHTKGVLISNKNSGFWLIHSVPHYPPQDKYSYPESGLQYGQSFLCVSFDLENLDNVGKQLQYNEPVIYKAKINAALKKKLPNVNKVIINETVESAPWYRLTTLTSAGNISFLSFAKSRKFSKDIYGDWIANVLKEDLLVESWLNGAGRLPSNCSNDYKVNNIESVKLPPDIQFKSSKDHSKWTSTNSNSNKTNWVCIGDNNRQEHQEVRGGGVLCSSNINLWRHYRETVVEIEKCTKLY